MNPPVDLPVDPDQDLLDRMRAGDSRGALHQLTERHGAAVYRYCCRMLCDAVLAQDVQQQVLLAVCRDIATFAGRSTLRSWLFSITKHRVLDAIIARKRARSRTLDAPLPEVVDLSDAPSDLLDSARLKAALVASIADLAVPVRTAVVLRYQRGLTFEQIAELCGEKSATLQMRVARALPVLRDSIRERTRRREPLQAR